MDAGVSQQRRQRKGGELRLVIVGHGPSIYSGLGAVIDSMTVLRLKRGLVETYDQKDWGSRTDYLCARSSRYDHGFFPFWLLSEPHGFSGKPTTGLCAIAEAVKRGYTDISLIGFDRLMHPDRPGEWLAHDKWAEHRYIRSLPARITELGDLC